MDDQRVQKNSPLHHILTRINKVRTLSLQSLIMFEFLRSVEIPLSFPPSGRSFICKNKSRERRDGFSYNLNLGNSAKNCGVTSSLFEIGQQQRTLYIKSVTERKTAPGPNQTGITLLTHVNVNIFQLLQQKLTNLNNLYYY